MQFSCRKEDIQEALQRVERAISRKNSPLPVLTGVHLQANEDGTVVVQASDYDLSIRTQFIAAVEKPGVVLIPGIFLTSLIRKVPSETVKFTYQDEDRKVRVESGSSDFTLLTIPAEDFPVIHEIETENKISLKDSIFRDLIRKTIFAASTDESRPVFTAGLLEIDGTTLKMVATNTHRLALKEITLEEEWPNQVRLLIPARVLQEIAKQINNDVPENVMIAWQRNMFICSWGNTYLTCRLIEGQFPDYRKVIPEEGTTRFEAKTQGALSAVDRVSLILREGDYNVVRVKVEVESENLVIAARNLDVGDSTESVEARITGENMELGFNVRYLMDILKHLESESFTGSTNGPLTPLLIKPTDEEGYLYIVTPVRK
jgi:DNA polymerase III, beta subunit